jgi:hypothetical protein
MMRTTRDNYFFESGGYEFESSVAEMVSSFAKREWGSGSVKFSTVQQDRYEGTDLYVLGVPIDITLAFERKNKTRRLDTLVLDGVTIELGIRIGNGKARFNTPVLVIGAETALGINKSNMWITLDVIKSNILKILDLGMDKYFLAPEAQLCGV